MRTILKLRWVMLVLWLAAAVLLTVLQPNIDGIIKERGQGSVSEKYPSSVAKALLDDMENSGGVSAILVFNDEDKLSDRQMEEIKAGIKSIKDSKDELGIVDMVDPFDTPEAEEQTVSKDGTTVIASVTYESKGREAVQVEEEINSHLNGVSAGHYITGGEFINSDFIKATFKGVDRSAFITIIFILLVLVVVFRSVATPVVSLLTVGIAYLCSMGLVSQLITRFEFPVTSLTQMFLILVLFGIGTDYNILLFNRFKEELALSSSVDEAILKTYRTAGKTVLFSGLTVLIAFAGLSFSEFDVYRSGNAVAIGIAILFLELMTLTPFAMKLLGKKLFWPAHNSTGHKDSKLWEKVSAATVRHPFITMAAVILAMIPILLFSSQKLSFDSLKEMNSSYASVKGFNIVSEHFSKGKTMPLTVVLKNGQAVDNNEALGVIDNLTEKLKKVKGVKEVLGPTQPQGTPIEQFYTDSHVKSLLSGLSATNDGIGKVSAGLKEAGDKLAAPDFSQVNELVKGTGDIQNGLGSISQALSQVEAGISGGAYGASGISEGIAAIKASLSTVNDSVYQLWQGYTGLQAGYAAMGENYKYIAQQLADAKLGADAMKGLVDNLEKSYPQLSSDQSFAALKKTAGDLSAGMGSLVAGLEQLNGKYEEAGQGFLQANESLKAINDGQRQMVYGMDSLQSGADELAAGLKAGSAGQQAIVENLAKLTDGLAQIKAGQAKLGEGLSGLGGGMTQLKEGLAAGTDGLKAISDGLGKTNSFLAQMTGSKTFFMPQEALESADIAKAFDAYMSKDRKTVKLLVTLEADPYSPEAMETAEEINRIIPELIDGTPLSDAVFGTGGESSRTNDLNQVASSDIARTQIIVLIGVFIVLLLVIRSFWIPVYIIAALMAAYYTSITVTRLFAVNLFHMDGIAWNVPFFAFVMIVALGVDYSIFLMTRFKEYGGIAPGEAIVLAAKNIGGVVMSAAVILAGTFLTLYPSGVQTLMQLAVGVSSGLLMLSLILLPVVIPAMISLPHALSRGHRTGNIDVGQ